MTSRRFSATTCGLALAAVVSIAAPVQPAVGHAAQDSRSLAPFVPTPNDVVSRMLTLAGVTEDDVVYDLGCGDGRIVIAAARDFGARGVGIDIDPQRIAEANANAEQAGVQHLVEFIEQGRDDGRCVRRYRRHLVSALVVECTVEADPDAAVAARRPDRVACIQHGRLGS